MNGYWIWSACDTGGFNMGYGEPNSESKHFLQMVDFSKTLLWQGPNFEREASGSWLKSYCF